MTERREPNERVIHEFTPEDWQVAVDWAPFAFQEIRSFVAKKTGRQVSYRGRVLEPSFAWIVPGGSYYGVDPVSLCQDLEHRALEAVALAAHDFNPDDGKGLSQKYLRRVINRELQKEFTRWKVTSASPNTISYGSTVVPMLPEGVDEPSYLEPWDRDDELSGLSPEDRDRLQTALGALTSKEAWALRMVAAKTPIEEIATTLGYKSPEAAYKLIRNAREKGQRAFEESQT